MESTQKKKPDLTFAGAALIIASQVLSALGSSGQISKEIREFREEFQESIVERDTYFARKTEITKLSQKIDELNLQISRLGKQLKSIDEFSMVEPSTSIIGCSSVSKI
jgi:predicted RNase H-like nuclease (RuvC/YqgF family)